MAGDARKAKEKVNSIHRSLSGSFLEVVFQHPLESRVAANIQSGIYFYKLQGGKYSETKKLVLIK